MAGGDEILVDEEARAIVSELKGLDPANPSSGAARVVSGPTPTGKSYSYMQKMREFAVAAQATTEALIKGIHTDSSNAVVAIDDLRRQDQEIMEMLKRLEREASAVNIQANPNGGATSRQPDVATPFKPEQAWPHQSDSSWVGK